MTRRNSIAFASALMAPVVSAIFSCYALAAAAPPTTVKYSLTFASKGQQARAFTLQTRPGEPVYVKSLTEFTRVTEIDSDHGDVSLKTGTLKEGVEASVAPAIPDATGRFDTVVEYTLWEAGAIASKGRHVVYLGSHQAAKLPAADGYEVTVTEL
jgi:hypothetical protein